jgi:hypothetical protein
MAAMRSPEDRDAVTVGIFTTLLIFAFVLALGAIPMVIANRLLGERPLLDALGYVVLAFASVSAFTYLWRHRRP